jgi:hypothetical protein
MGFLQTLHPIDHAAFHVFALPVLVDDIAIIG